jgi:hypothetical protein
MGSAFEELAEVEIEGVARGTSKLRSLELVGPDGVVAEGTLEGEEGRLAVSAAAPWLYLRVRQEDGEMAWSSPIFMGPASPSAG